MSRFLFSLLCVNSFIFLQKSSISISNQINDILGTSVRLVLSTVQFVVTIFDFESIRGILRIVESPENATKRRGLNYLSLSFLPPTGWHCRPCVFTL